MSSYEKQMQWKKATSEKAKKDKVERAAEEEYSFTPVIYTNKEPNERTRHEQRHQKAERSGRKEEPGKSRSGPDSDLYSPVRGTASINSHQNSEAGTHSATGYGSVYSEQHNHRGYEDNRSNRNSRHLNDHGELDHVEEEDRDQEDDQSNDYSHHRQLNSLGTLNRNGNNVNGAQNSEMDSRRRSQTSKHRSSRRESGVSRRPRYSSGSSMGGSTGGEEEDEVDEPIIEILERERKQWREEREKLIQCIHLQQLELSQRSLAAHERAADIAKEFARAIECFEERLVSVEGNVQKEIMSIKSIAESLLHATQAPAAAQAQAQPALSMINTSYSGANYSNSGSNSRA